MQYKPLDKLASMEVEILFACSCSGFNAGAHGGNTGDLQVEDLLSVVNFI